MSRDKPRARERRLIDSMVRCVATLEIAGMSRDDAWRIVLEEAIRQVDAAYQAAIDAEIRRLDDLRYALRDAKVPEIAADRIAVQYATDRIKVLRRQARPPDPEMGWRDGRWTRSGDLEE